MGAIVKWFVPDTSQVTYDKVEVYRASTLTGSYSTIITQEISDNSYFDISGSSGYYYKVRFAKTSTSEYSDYSDPVKGDGFNGYCSFDDVRDMTGILTTDITDSQLFTLIKNYSIPNINKDIGIEHRDEQVLLISYEKENKIDGSNKTFYTKEFPIGDLNDDGIVDTSDIELYTLNSLGERTVVDLTSIDDVQIGKFTVSGAISSDKSLWIQRYRSFPVEVYPNTDHYLRLACVYLTAAMAYSRVNANKISKYRIGKISVMQQSQSFKQYMNNYNEIINKLKYFDAIQDSKFELI